MLTMSASAYDELAQQIARDGFAVVKGVIDAEALTRSEEVVRAKVAQNGGHYTQFSGPEGVREVFAADLDEMPGFRALYENVYERMTQSPAPKAPLVQFVRAFTGGDDKDHALNFHFDSYVLTMLPTGSTAGDLLLVPNFRGFRKSYLRNTIDKAIFCNPLAQSVFRYLYRRNSPFVRHVALTPGDLYLFSGYRTLHSNETCDSDQIRSTAVFLFENPHKASWKGAPAAA